jgi:biopolymer transport protein TolR
MAFGRLERSRGEPPMSEINMTPLIDVMLVLLVIFMITAPLMAGSVKVRLPQATAPVVAPVDATPVLELSLDASGQAYLGKARVSQEALVRSFVTAAARDTQTELRLRADRSVPYGHVVEVMALARKSGLSRIAFVTDLPAPAP